MATLRRVALGLLVLPMAALVLIAAMSAGASPGQTGPGVDDLKRLSANNAKPKLMPQAKGQPNRKGKTPASRAKKLGTKKNVRGSAPKGRSPNQLNWNGWPDPRLAQVGQIWAQAYGESGLRPYCSGTVVSRTLVLTAGHCVVNTSVRVNGLNPKHLRILFVPGQTWNTPSSTDVADVKAPYGVWEAQDSWAPRSFRAGTSRLDWGLIEIKPQNGRFIGNVTGSWRIQTGITFNVGARIWSTGYPGMGFWSRTSGYVGRGQYACDSTWDGVWRQDGGTEIWIKCPMNGGSSGGPWLVQLNTGEWVIGGVNDWCDDTNTYDDESDGRGGTFYCTPVSDSLRSLVFDNRFITFWNSVLPLLTY